MITPRSLAAILGGALIPLAAIGCTVETGEGPGTGGTTGEEQPAPDTGEAAAAGRPEHPPLLVIMRDLDEAMDAINDGIWLAEPDSVVPGADAVADHPRVSPEEREMIRGILGEEMAGFAAADRRVHEAALRVAAAARRLDDGGSVEEVLEAYQELERGCVACHDAYRARIRAGRMEGAGGSTGSGGSR